MTSWCARIAIGIALIVAAKAVPPAVDSGAPSEASTGTPSGAPMGAPAANDAETLFFDALQRHPARRDEALAALTNSVCSPDATGRDVLLLGMTHLWIVAEGDAGPSRGPSASLHAHAVCALHCLERAESLLPDDDRIPGWRAAAEWAVARLEHREDEERAARATLARLAVADPCFHSVALGIASFDQPRESPAFVEALTAMNAAFGCNADDPSGQDRPRWPSNVVGFLVALADYRLKAGDTAGAEAALTVAEARPGSATWQFRSAIDERFAGLRERAARYANDDPDDDPPFFLGRGAAACRACHGASGG